MTHALAHLHGARRVPRDAGGSAGGRCTNGRADQGQTTGGGNRPAGAKPCERRCRPRAAPPRLLDLIGRLGEAARSRGRGGQSRVRTDSKGGPFMTSVRWSVAFLVLAAPLSRRTRPSRPCRPRRRPRRAALKKSCDKGAAADCHAWPRMHRSGQGAPKDIGKASGLFKKACDLRHAGLVPRDGGDPPRARRRQGPGQDRPCYLQRACEMAAGKAARGRASSTDSGRTSRRTWARPPSSSSRAAWAASGRACGLFGTMHREGLVVVKDAAKAAQYYQKACEGRRRPELHAARRAST